jgi:intergrase/recombinase
MKTFQGLPEKLWKDFDFVLRDRAHAARALKCRFIELRDYYATFMVRNGLIKEEVDLLQGRIPLSIFLRHYWSPSLKELRDRTLKAITELE